jgi:hypothetical protein
MRSLLFGLAIIVLPLTDLTPAVAHKIHHYRVRNPPIPHVFVIGGMIPTTAETLAQSRSHATPRVVGV